MRWTLAVALATWMLPVALPAAPAVPDKVAPPADIEESPPPAHPAPHARTAQIPELRVVAARDLVGRAVRSADGRMAGEIQSVVIDLHSGRMDFVLIQPGPALGGTDLVAVPWPALVVPVHGGGPIDSRADLAKLKDAPRVTPQTMAEMIKARQVGQVWRHYGLTPPQPADKAAPAPERALVVTAEGPRMVPAAGAGDDPGMPVQADNGATLGKVDQVMIDAERGRVAYMLVAAGGFLGLNVGWLPVPFDSLHTKGDSPALTLDANATQLSQLPLFEKDALPDHIERDDLAALYEHYGVEPYWQ